MKSGRDGTTRWNTSAPSSQMFPRMGLNGGAYSIAVSSRSSSGTSTWMVGCSRSPTWRSSYPLTYGGSFA